MPGPQTTALAGADMQSPVFDRFGRDMERGIPAARMSGGVGVFGKAEREEEGGRRRYCWPAP